jgi:hypothetical protein
VPDLTLIATTLQTLFSDHATRLAQQTGLVRRHSKLSGPLILLILVAGFIQHPTASYNILAQVATDYGVSVTRQAIQQRLTRSAVTFFQHLFQCSLHMLQQQVVSLPIPILTQFHSVYLLDSSQIALPARLANQYPAPGGDGPKAGIKWQVLWEILTGNLCAVLSQPAKQSDHRYQDYLTLLQGGSLILFDLGYVALEVLRQLMDMHVYFICRWNPRLEAFTQDGQPVELSEVLEECISRGGRIANQVELTLRLGVEAQLPLRVVASKVPVSVREQRRRRAHATEKRRGYQYSAAYLTLLDWNIYITNASVEQLSGEAVRMVYRARWQVELLFKLWKMQGELDRVAGRTTGRVMCEMYAKLIGMVIFGYLTAPIRLTEGEINEGNATQGTELSPNRAWQVWQRKITMIASALHTGKGVTDVLGGLYSWWKEYGRKERRKDRPTTFGRLSSISGMRAIPGEFDHAHLHQAQQWLNWTASMFTTPKAAPVISLT